MTWEFWYKLDSLGTRVPIITNAVSGTFSPLRHLKPWLAVACHGLPRIGLLYNELLFLDVNETGYLIIGAQGRTEYREQYSVSPIVAGQWMHVAVVINRGAPCSTQDDPVSQEPWSRSLFAKPLRRYAIHIYMHSYVYTD